MRRKIPLINPQYGIGKNRWPNGWNDQNKPQYGPNNPINNKMNEALVK